VAGPVVSPQVLSPGFALRVDLVTGDAAVGGATRRACVIAVKTSAGTATENAVNASITGSDQARTLGGAASAAHLACKAIFAEYKLARVDLVCVAEPTGGGAAAATQTITFDDSTPVTETQTVTVVISGREITFEWTAGVSDVDAATECVSSINEIGDDLFVIASNGGGTLAVVTLTARSKGTQGNDVTVAVSMTGGTGGDVVAGGAALAAGVGVMDITTAIAAIATTQYDLILLCASNADAILASSTGAVGKLVTHVNGHLSGFGALLQQIVVGVTGTLANAKVGPSQHNFGPMEYVFCRSGRSLPFEWGGAEVGARLREEAFDVNVNRSNRIDMPYFATLYGPADLTTGALTPTELEDGLQSGLSCMTFTVAGKPFVSIPRTTYWKDTDGNPDRRLVFVSQVTGLYAVAADLRSYLPQRFPGAKLTPDIAEGDDDLPPNVVDESTVKAVIIARLREWQRIGVVRRDRLDAAIADGTLRVQVNSINSSKLDIQIPLSIIPPLTTWDVNILGGN
jgi:phage tail sheath gpL-like